jgi:predicted ATPase
MDIKDLDNFLEINETNLNLILSSILSNITINNTINTSPSIYNDTNIDEWIKKLTITRGGSIVIDKIIKNPINNKQLLLARQNTFYEIPKYQIDILKSTEKDLLWIMHLKEEIDDDMSINLLFPSTYLINRFNNYRTFLDLYHIYKIIFMPLTTLIYPLSIILTPYFYLNKYMHLNLSFFKYLNILFQFLKMLFKPSGDLRKDLMKLISFLIYVFIYLYSIYQTFLISYIIFKTREKLFIKIKGLVDFIKTSLVLIKRTDFNWFPFNIYNLKKEEVLNSIKNLEEINYDISTIYKLWKNPKFKSSIIIILKVIYILDTINTISSLKKNKYWSIPTYSKTNTKIWGLRNPLLNDNQISNPVDLKRNLIITGVNAGGKTTFVKSIASNIILSQTFGIINGIKGELMIYDAIISFMRVKDELGSKSYFEAETDCCSNIIRIADDINKNKKKGLFILDEPMHSTPPIEGMSVAYAIAKYLGNLEGISIIITTHFHNLISLEENKKRFLNLSVNAIKDENNKFIFDYKINKGSSKQTIAIELLKKQKFNDEIINSAIEIKNKLCNENLRNDF